MARVYSADLVLVDRSTWHPADLDAVALVIGRWAGIHEPLKPGVHKGRRGADVAVELMDADDGVRLWKLLFIHPDDRSSEVQWRTEVTVVVGRKPTILLVRIDRSNVGRMIVPTLGSVKAPGFLGELIEAKSVAVWDGGRELALTPWVISDRNANQFADLVLTETRNLPVVAFTPRDEDVIDGQPLSEALAGLAHVALVLSPASWILKDLLPEGTNVYGGAARIIWPGARDALTASRHYLYYSDRSAHSITSDVVRRITEAAVSVTGWDRRVQPIERNVRRREEKERFTSLEAAIDQLRDGDSDAVAQLTAANLQMAKMAEDRDLALELAASEEEARAEQLDVLFRLEAERDSWKSKFEEARRVSRSSGEVALDASSALLQEISDTVSELGPVDGSRPREFLIGSSFVETVNGLGPNYKDRVIRTAAYLVLNSPELLARQADHVLRTGSGGNDPARIRRRDNATARRCAIEQGTSAARRMHYWVLSDGSIELASVNVHDDVEIPE